MQKSLRITGRRHFWSWPFFYFFIFPSLHFLTSPIHVIIIITPWHKERWRRGKKKAEERERVFFFLLSFLFWILAQVLAGST